MPKFEHRLDKFQSGVYTPSATELTYATLLEKARQALEQGNSVVLDASFIRYRHREAARELARTLSARFRIVECIADENIVRSRLDARQLRKDEPSDGRWEIYCEQKTHFEPMRPEEQAVRRVWDSTTDLNAFLRSLVRELIKPSFNDTPLF